MGWPLAVANGLGARRSSAVFLTFTPLGAGHFLAMAVVLVPFTLLSAYLAWSRPIRIGAGVLVLLFGVYRLIDRRHPRLLARVRPTQLVLWSFLVATAHGAGLMLMPFAIGLCAPAGGATQPLVTGLGTALLASAAHTAAMLLAGLVAAWIVYRYLGLRALNRGWLDLDAVWAASLIVAGAASIGMAWSG
jgi:hypothetical protein